MISARGWKSEDLPVGWRADSVHTSACDILYTRIRVPYGLHGAQWSRMKRYVYGSMCDGAIRRERGGGGEGGGGSPLNKKEGTRFQECGARTQPMPGTRQ